VGADECHTLCHELGEHFVAGSSAAGTAELLRSLSAADREKRGAVGLAELTAALEAVPVATLEWWVGLTERGEIELMPTAPPGAPVVVSAAARRLLRTIQQHVEETGVGVRFEAPFSRAQIVHMVQLLARAASDGPAPAADGPPGELLAAARLTLQAAAGVMEFMQVEPTPALIREIGAAAERQLGAPEPAAADAELLTKLLGQTAFAKGVLAALPTNGAKMRALLLDGSVRAAEGPGGSDGGALSLAGYTLVAADTAALVAALPALLCQLTDLNLFDLRLGSQFGLAIAAAMQSEQCTLTHLNLRYNELGAAAGLAIAVVVQLEHCQLTDLNFGANNLGAAAGLAFAAAVQSEHSKLTHLNLEHNRLGAEGGLGFAVAMQSKWCTLTDLNLYNNQLGAAAGLAIAEALQSEQCTLTHLNLRYNDLGAAAGLAIAVALQSEHCQLTDLNLSNNQLGAAAGLAFALAVQSEQCQLTHLNLGANDLGEAAGLGFAAAVVRFGQCMLTDLNLASNQLGAAAGLGLAVALQSEQCHLTNLDLSNNELGVVAGLAFAAVVQSEQCTLTNLNLASNELGGAAKAAIKAALPSAHV
jgi:Ran GTPase-activating protein (RanGAP) involved in mRNA processing and transport